ncbi:hypothetical protein G8770_13410 [Aestuariicella hydrocarbonica]|uniref:Uncharacterized protein n=1 Tax=Pseudomaricurvus hydrocarbonicus TaxID=1470433 RepID=A0A9E5JW24_9GAMM|nr:hypothetical protein [Aestuariicella hydrocarbonica]NHO66541.1 hypothetical protein [Aestuariicella hydrocarbonica]
MQASSKSFLLSILFTAGLSCLTIIALNAYVDPWRFFHDSGLAHWDSDGRQQNPGIIRQRAFNVAVIGTSMTQNFRPEELQQLFGGQAAVLSISAGTGREQALTAGLALQQQTLDTLVWGVHPGSFILPAQEVKGNAFPGYLYDNHWLNDIYYLFNISNIEKALKDWRGALRSLSARQDVTGQSWQNLQYWGDKYQYGCPDIMALQMSRRGLPAVSDDFRVADEQIVSNVSENLLATVQAHPGTQFKLFFPPFSELYWALLAERQPLRYAAYRRLMREVVIQLTPEPNVELFDFTALQGVVDNLQNYKDLIHFSPQISSQLLRMMQAGEFRVTDAQLGTVGHFPHLMKGAAINMAVSECLQAPAEG